MIKSIQVELQIDSRQGSSENVTEILGVAPDEQYEIGDLMVDGPRRFDWSIWRLRSVQHAEEIAAAHGSDPWARVRWVLDCFSEDAPARIHRLRGEGYEVVFSVVIINDHKENTVIVPADVMARVGRQGLSMEILAASTAQINISPISVPW